MEEKKCEKNNLKCQENERTHCFRISYSLEKKLITMTCNINCPENLDL